MNETEPGTDILSHVHHHNIRSAESNVVPAQSLEEVRNMLIPQHAQHFGLSYGSLHYGKNLHVSFIQNIF